MLGLRKCFEFVENFREESANQDFSEIKLFKYFKFTKHILLYPFHGQGLTRRCSFSPENGSRWDKLKTFFDLHVL